MTILIHLDFYNETSKCGWLTKNRKLLLRCGLRSLIFRYLQLKYLLRDLSLVHRWHFLNCVLTWWRKHMDSLRHPLINNKLINCIHVTLSFWGSHILITHLLWPSITLGLLHPCGYYRKHNIQTIAIRFLDSYGKHTLLACLKDSFRTGTGCATLETEAKL